MQTAHVDRNIYINICAKENPAAFTARTLHTHTHILLLEQLTDYLVRKRN